MNNEILFGGTRDGGKRAFKCISCGNFLITGQGICEVCGYPILEEKFNAPETILRVGNKRTGKAEKPCLESDIQANAILAVSQKFINEIRIWRNNTGAIVKYDQFIRFGINGQADVSGIMTGGIRLEIEFKRKGQKQSPEQVNFQKMIEAFGGLYLLCDGDIQGQIIEPIQRKLEERLQD